MLVVRERLRRLRQTLPCLRRLLRNRPVLILVRKSVRNRRLGLRGRIIMVKGIRLRSLTRHFDSRSGKECHRLIATRILWQRRRRQQQQQQQQQHLGWPRRPLPAPIMPKRLQMIPPRINQRYHRRIASWKGQIAVGMRTGMGQQSMRTISRERLCFIS